MEQPGYQPIRIYDTPGILAAQLLEGEASFGSIKDLFLSPEGLSPEQRTSVVDRLAGGDHLSKALLGVATNPFVWLLFLTGPVGAKAMQEGKSLFSVAKKYSSQQQKSLGFMSFLRNVLEEFTGTNATNIALGVSDDLQKTMGKYRAMVSPAEYKLLVKLDQMAGGNSLFLKKGVLDHNAYSRNSVEYKLLKDYNEAAAIRTARLDEDYTRGIAETTLEAKVRQGSLVTDISEHMDQRVAHHQGSREQFIDAFNNHSQKLRQSTWQEVESDWAAMSWAERKNFEHNGVKGKTGLFNRYWEERGEEIVEFHTPTKGASDTRALRVKERAKFEKDKIDEVLSRYGQEGTNYLQATNQARKQAFVDHIGDEEYYAKTGLFRHDGDKVARLASAVKRQLREADDGPLGSLHRGSTTLQGKEALLAALGHDTMEIVKRTSAENAQKVIVRRLQDLTEPEHWGGLWGSRNTYARARVNVNGRMQAPPIPMDAAQLTNLDMAPMSASAAMSKHVAPITEKELLLDPEFMKSRRDWLNLEGEVHLQDVEKRVGDLWAKKQQAVMTFVPNLDQMHKRYVGNITQSTVFDTRMASEAMFRGDKDALVNLSDGVKDFRVKLGGVHEVRVGDSLDDLKPEVRKLTSPGDMMDRLYLGEQSDARRAYVRDSLVPGALNNAGPEWLAVRNAQIRSKELAQWFADSWIGRTIENSSKAGKGFIGRVREVADLDSGLRMPDFSDGVARWFYASHLGLNLSSMVLNMTQPLLLAATAGTLDEVVGAYGAAFKEMADYAKKRAGHGLFISADKKLELMEDSFKYMGRATGGRNLLGIGPDMAELLDVNLARSQGRGSKVFDLMMAGFEKTEWMNRNVSAHLFERIATRGGRAASPYFMEDLQRFVLQTQFGQNDLNTPKMFLHGPMANRLLRQFLTFPVRTLTSTLKVFPTLGGEEYWKGLGRVMARGMGYSALVYEAGKGLAGVDLSRGLFASSLTALAGGDRLLEKDEEILPIPPVVGVPVDIIRAFASDDMSMLADSVARLVPGGVALNRALGVMGPLPSMGLSGLPGAFQRTYADWTHPLPTGEVPVFKGDGTLVEYRRPAELVAKGLGVDLGTWGQQGELDNYLVKQREEIIKYRHEYLRALASNENGRAQAIAADYSQKFKGLPLTVTQEQVRAFHKGRAQTRTQRAMGRIPGDLRPQYQGMVEATGATMEQQPVSDEQVREMMRRVQAGAAAASSKPGAFQNFGGF